MNDCSTSRMHTGRDPSSEELQVLLRDYDVRFNPEKYKLKHTDGLPLRAASVLLPLFYKNGELHVFLTVRSKGMPSHAGHVAFPGGMRSEEDADAIATALREAEEEVGLDPSKVNVIAVLPSCVVRPNSLVATVVALIPDDFVPKLNPREVEFVFDLPLRRFIEEQGQTVNTYQWEDGVVFHVYHFLDDVNGRQVDTWGFTAIQIAQCAAVIYNSDITFKGVGEQGNNMKSRFNISVTQSIINNIKAKL